MAQQIQKSRVFVSHSSADKAFVKVLVGELEDADLDVWFDSQELTTGDSIVSGISAGLKDTDYLLVVLSKAAVASKWVNAELNFGLMKQLSEGGIVVIPVLKEDCDIPPLLRDRIYADFRGNFKASLKKLLELFRMERGIPTVSNQSGDSVVFLGKKPSDIPSCNIERTRKCVDKIRDLSLGDLRRLIFNNLNNSEIRAIYLDVFNGDIEDKGQNRHKLDRCVDLILDAKRLGCMDILQEELCKSFPQSFGC